MNTGKIYLDSCILIAFEHKKDDRNEIISEAIKCLEDLDVEVYASDWTLAELVKILVKDYNYPKKKAMEISERIKEESKIGNVDINWIEVGSEKKYTFQDFFEYLKNQLVTNKDLHIADAIHNLIMTNNEIDVILTTDTDFDAITTVTTLRPEALKIMKPKKKINK